MVLSQHHQMMGNVCSSVGDSPRGYSRQWRPADGRLCLFIMVDVVCAPLQDWKSTDCQQQALPSCQQSLNREFIKSISELLLKLPQGPVSRGQRRWRCDPMADPRPSAVAPPGSRPLKAGGPSCFQLAICVVRTELAHICCFCSVVTGHLGDGGPGSADCLGKLLIRSSSLCQT